MFPRASKRRRATCRKHGSDALEQHARAGEQSAAQNQSALTAAAASFEQHAASLVQSVDRSHADLRVELAQHARRAPRDMERRARHDRRLVARAMAADERGGGGSSEGHLRRARADRARHVRAIAGARERDHRGDRAARAGGIGSAEGGRRSRRRNASEALRFDGPRHRDARRTQPPARHASKHCSMP